VTRRLALAIAVVPLIVLVGLRSAWATYACAIDGKVRAACCCPEKAHSNKQPVDDDAPRIARAGCCNVTIGETSDKPDAREAERPRVDHVPSVETAIVVTPVVEPPAPTMLRRAYTTLPRPPPPARLIYLANRTILR
jgi:hypothetical protein